MRSKYSYLSYNVLILLVFLFFSCNKNYNRNEQQGKIEILINTKKSSITINNKIINDFNLNEIKKQLGKPDRIEIDTVLSRYEEHGYGDYPSTSTMIKVINYYYIYDELGIMFYSFNGKGTTKEPKKLSLHFNNKRSFTNVALLPFSPNNSFEGVLKINNEILNVGKKIIPEGVNDKTKDFQLFHMSFGPTSIGTVIDRLYSINAEPYMLFYLDNEENQKISYVEILDNGR